MVIAKNDIVQLVYGLGITLFKNNVPCIRWIKGGRNGH